MKDNEQTPRGDEFDDFSADPKLQREADRLVAAMEQNFSDNAKMNNSNSKNDDLETSQLAEAIRESALTDLPAPNESLRHRLIDELDSTQSKEQASLKATASPPVKLSNPKPLFSIFRVVAGLAIAASLFLMCVAGWSWRNLPVSESKIAKLNDIADRSKQFDIPIDDRTFDMESKPAVAQPSIDESMDILSPAEGPDVLEKYDSTLGRWETQTRTAPATKMRTEMRTRQVPVTDAEGKTRMRTENYSIQVPYSEQVAQNPAVFVPSKRVSNNKSDESAANASGFGWDNDEEGGRVGTSGMTGGDTSKTQLGFSEMARADRPEGRDGTSGMAGGDTSRVGGGQGPGGGGAVYKGWFSEGESVGGEWHRKMNARTKYSRIRTSEEKLASEQYHAIYENEFKSTDGASALSTFSIDVDTASYANMRRFITNGQAIPRNAIRIEELVNYFQYDYPQPEGDDPFSVNMEMATCPWNERNKLLRVGLKGQEIHRDERPASNIVFLLDVSGSMQSPGKLELLKSGFIMMVNQLTENDRVSIVTYAGNAGVVLEPTTGDQTKKITDAISALQAGGSTNGSQGIQLAYEMAQRHFIKDGTNRVVLATDGDLNVGITRDEDLVKLIKEKASEGVFLTVLGFGTGNLKDGKMEKLADNGNGMYAYIDSLKEAHKVLVESMSGSLVTIAKDVKIQIEFNPGEVKAYRLIGYENRVLAAKDFDDDRKDAGEIGAGHTVTALYELVTVDAPELTTTIPQGLKYQKKEQPKEAEVSNTEPGEILTLALRYKKPDENESKRIEFTLQNEDHSFSTASNEFRFASSVAAFGMILRGSQFKGDATTDWVKRVAASSIGEDRSGYRREFIDLVRRCGQVR